nr:hypothetical protein [Stenotrophomonas pavanii]
MAGLRLLGGGHDAVFAGTARPTDEQRLARYRSALAAHPDRFHALRVRFGEIQQRVIKAGHRINYAAWQKRMSALWPPVGRD